MNSYPAKLELKGISFGYENQTILRDITLKVNNSQCIAILGPSGCGKSTLLNVIAGLYPPESGHILVDGKNVEGISSIFAYMPQKDLLLPWMDILSNVCLYGKLHRQDIRQQALRRLHEFGLQGYESVYPHQLSGGMRQRAAFLRTALCDADILLLDEPFGALDVITREDMQDWLIKLRQSWNKTMILVTHDIDEALLLADQILIISPKDGRIACRVDCQHPKKTREWLFRQADIKQQVYNAIKEYAQK